MIAGSSGARFSTNVIRRASAVRSRASMRSTSASVRSSVTRCPPLLIVGQGGTRAQRPALDRPRTHAEDAPMIAASTRAMLHALTRSALVMAGLLLLAVGVGDVIAGWTKIGQYRELVRATASIERPDPAALFPTANEGQERHAVAVDKLAFYQLVVTTGQLLAALGFTLMAAGALRVRIRALRAAGGLPGAGGSPAGKCPPPVPERPPEHIGQA